MTALICGAASVAIVQCPKGPGWPRIQHSHIASYPDIFIEAARAIASSTAGKNKNKNNLPLATVLLFCYYRIAAESEVAMGKIHFTVYRTTSDQFDLPVLCRVLLHGGRSQKAGQCPDSPESTWYFFRVTELRHGWRPSALNNVATLKTKVSRGGPSDSHNICFTFTLVGL